jgi:hypothetical protein
MRGFEPWAPAIVHTRREGQRIHQRIRSAAVRTQVKGVGSSALLVKATGILHALGREQAGAF